MSHSKKLPVIMRVMVDKKQLDWVKFLGIPDDKLRETIESVVRERIQHLIWAETTGEEETCADCGNAMGWAPHTDNCRFNKKNLPPELQ